MLSKAIGLFQTKYIAFAAKVQVLECVIKVALLEDSDKEMKSSLHGIARCHKCKTGLLEIRPMINPPTLICSKCQKQVVLNLDADRAEKTAERCLKCEAYMLNVLAISIIE